MRLNEYLTVVDIHRLYALVTMTIAVINKRRNSKEAPPVLDTKRPLRGPEQCLLQTLAPGPCPWSRGTSGSGPAAEKCLYNIYNQMFSVLYPHSAAGRHVLPCLTN